jgi:hypothetical protein
MNHTYDNLSLSFGGLVDIYAQAAAGNLTATEKVDGQNLFFTYDLRDGTAKFARRADEASNGGITKEVLNAEFVRKRDASSDPEGYQHVVDAFYYGMTAIEQALESVPQEVLYTLFERAKAADVNDDTPYDVPTVFANCEIMYSKNRNMIMYDGDFIVFHNFQLLNENLEGLPEDELNKIDASTREKFNTLVAEVEKQEQSVDGNSWRVVGPQERELVGLDSSFVDDARQKIETIIQKYNLTLDNTFADYVAKGVEDYISKAGFSVSIPQDTVELLQRAVIDPDGFVMNPGQIGGVSLPPDIIVDGKKKSKAAARKKIIANHIGASKADVALLSNCLSKTKAFALMSAILEPFAQITPELTARLMQGVPSAFMDDNDRGTKVFRRTVELAINHIENTLANADMSDPKMVALERKYRKQMKRLQSVDNISTSMEGVVFEYPPMSRQYYKFTGGFAAANQILGYLGWDVKAALTQQAEREIDAEMGTPTLNEVFIRKMVRRSIRRTITEMFKR